MSSKKTGSKAKSPKKAAATKVEEEVPELERGGTMVGTAAEGEAFIAKQGGLTERRPKEDAEESADGSEEAPAPSPKKKSPNKAAAKKAAAPKKAKSPPKPKLNKGSTMAGTAAEGEAFIARANKKAGIKPNKRKDDKAITAEATKLAEQLSKKEQSATGSKKRKLTELERTALEGSTFVSRMAAGRAKRVKTSDDN